MLFVFPIPSFFVVQKLRFVIVFSVKAMFLPENVMYNNMQEPLQIPNCKSNKIGYLYAQRVIQSSDEDLTDCSFT